MSGRIYSGDGQDVRAGIISWVDSECPTSRQDRDVVATLREALEVSGGGVHITESTELSLYIFSKRPLTKDELERFEARVSRKLDRLQRTIE